MMADLKWKFNTITFKNKMKKNNCKKFSNNYETQYQFYTPFYLFSNNQNSSFMADFSEKFFYIL